MRMKTKRQEDICEILRTEGSAGVSQLALKLDVTEKTIRQDLTELESQGVVTRVHGGARLKTQQAQIIPVSFGRTRNLLQKQAIARAALSLIEDNDVLILDAGSTTRELAGILDRHVTVITNDPVISYTLIAKTSVTLYSTGGELHRNETAAFIGPDVLQMIRNYHANKVFLGTAALDPHRGLMVNSAQDGEVKRAFLDAAQEAILLADTSKLHRNALYSFMRTDQINTFVTDDALSDEDEQILRIAGVNVIRA